MGWQALHALHCWISKSFDVNTVLQSKFKWTSDLNDCIHSAVNSGQVYIHFTECANVSILHAFECEIIYSSYISILCAVCHWFIRFVANLRLTNINMKCVMNVSLCVCVCWSIIVIDAFIFRCNLATRSTVKTFWISSHFVCARKQHQFNTLHTLPASIQQFQHAIFHKVHVFKCRLVWLVCGSWSRDLCTVFRHINIIRFARCVCTRNGRSWLKSTLANICYWFCSA